MVSFILWRKRFIWFDVDPYKFQFVNFFCEIGSLELLSKMESQNIYVNCLSKSIWEKNALLWQMIAISSYIGDDVCCWYQGYAKKSDYSVNFWMVSVRWLDWIEFDFFPSIKFGSDDGWWISLYMIDPIWSDCIKHIYICTCDSPSWVIFLSILRSTLH